jgi:hypothetical protein
MTRSDLKRLVGNVKVGESAGALEADANTGSTATASAPR